MQMEGESGGGEGEEEVRSYKILVLGNSGAGKTSLVRRSVRDYFSRDYRSAPISKLWSTSVMAYYVCFLK